MSRTQLSQVNDLLIERIPTLRVLLIITFRPEFTPLWILT